MLYYPSIEPAASLCSTDDDLCYLLINRLPASSRRKDTLRCQKSHHAADETAQAIVPFKTKWKSRDQRRQMYTGGPRSTPIQKRGHGQTTSPQAACNDRIRKPGGASKPMSKSCTSKSSPFPLHMRSSPIRALPRRRKKSMTRLAAPELPA